MSTYGQREAHDTMRLVNKALIAQVRQMSGADSEGVKAAASALRREIRKTLSTPGADRHASLKSRRVRGTPSAPGAPPAMQSGKLAKSVGSAVVGGVRRVGFSNYRARIQEFGGVVEAAPAHAAGELTGRVFKRSKSGRQTKFRTAKDAVKARIIPPRPFMARSLAAAEPKMTEVLVGSLAKAGGA